jgi:hypothetical protein
MTSQHLFTNKGKLWLVQGNWDTVGANNVKIGLLQTPVPSTAITYEQIADFNTVADLLAVATEATFTNYVRKSLSRSSWLEDDSMDVAAADAADVVWTTAGGPVYNAVAGLFIYVDGVDDASRTLISVSWFDNPVVTNELDLTFVSNPLYRAS